MGLFNEATLGNSTVFRLSVVFTASGHSYYHIYIYVYLYIYICIYVVEGKGAERGL